jgi:transcriptional regulator GlxA family with amidase domain
MADALERHLDACGTAVDELNALVREAEVDRTITRADQLADCAGVSLRTLQRQFTAHLGVGPKRVVQRFRLLDAAAAAHAGDRTDWPALATELGFADQAHLIRAFTAAVGTPPATYQKQA